MACGKLAGRLHSDDSWEIYTYDTLGRKVIEKRSWLDAPLNADDARVIIYDYTPQDPLDSDAPEDRRRPRAITEIISGTAVSKTCHIHAVCGATGERTEITERCHTPDAAFGDPANLRTTTVRYPFDPSLVTSARIKSITHPDGRMDLHDYAAGTFTPNVDPSQPGVFTPNPDPASFRTIIAGTGDAIRATIFRTTADAPSGIPDRTLREVIVRDALGRELQRETELCREGGYVRIGWRVFLYDDAGNLSDTFAHDGTRTEETWGCCGKASETDARGIRRSYLRDDLGRIISETRQTAGGDLTTTYTRDAAGRILTETISGGGLSRTTARAWDTAGRLAAETDAAGLTTRYGRSASGRITFVTLPSGATKITERYPDGKVKSITGTAVTHRFYTYGVNPDGTRWTRVHVGAADAPLWEKTTVDALGRTISIEKPGPEGVETTFHTYNDRGFLHSVSPPGMAPTLYAYDALGNLTRKGLDTDWSGTLDPASPDRIDETDTSYVSAIGDLWRMTLQRVYAKPSDPVPTTTAARLERRTGLGTGGLTEETVTVDVRGNLTFSRTVVDRSTGTVTRTVDHPETAIDSRTVTRYGLPVSSRSRTGVETTFTHDALGQRTGVTDPRTGTTTFHYDEKGRLAKTDDPGGRRTTYTYDPGTDRKIAETNAAGKAVRYRYDARGLVTHTWGDAAMPVHYRYDDTGRKIEMYTYRAGDGWSGEAWPEGATGPAAVTRWHYDPATGLLTGKSYDDGKGVTYTHTTGGRLKTRTWARTADGQPIVTTYAYDPATGELTGIDYSDATPDITFTYDRLGRKASVTDAVGTRVFTYNETLDLASETFTHLTGDPPPVVPAARNDYHVAYGYEPDTGRFSTIDWKAGENVYSGTYSYLDNSDLISQLTTASGQKTTYTYEADRDLRTQIRNEFGDRVISQYDYTYDVLGRRNSVTTGGEAFASTSLTPIAGTTTHKANALNQYTEITQTPGPSMPATPIYDDDGNMIEMSGASGKVQYGYNAENRLISVQSKTPEEGDKRVELIYDYKGKRVRKSVFTQMAGAWEADHDTQFLYNGWNLVQEWDKTGTIQKSYLWGLDLSHSLVGAGGVGGILAIIPDSEPGVQLYNYEANGNIGQILEVPGGAIVAHYEYASFGNTISSYGSSSANNPFRYSTKHFDEETNLYYYGHRYYSAKLGRWINRDPIEEIGGTNLYAFVYNSPLTAIDIIGLFSAVDSCPLTNCPCDKCDITMEYDVSKPLGSQVTDSYDIIDYKIKNGILQFVVLIEHIGRYYGVITTPRSPIAFKSPKTYNVVSDLWAKFNCIVETCLETMDRKEICTKNKGSEYKIFNRDWVVYVTNVY